MILRIRTILDVNDDVIRDIEITENSKLVDLHNMIIKSYGFLGKEMASFYRTDKNWQQGDEMPLVDVGLDKNFNNEELKNLFSDENSRLLYVYDFLALWTFFIEVVETKSPKKNTEYPNLVFSEGTVPKTPPIKNFQEFDSSEEDKQEEDENNFDLDQFY